MKLSETYDPNHSDHFHRVKMFPLFTRAALFYRDREYDKACESFNECLQIFRENRALSEKTDPFFQCKVFVNLYFTYLQLRKWDKCREYGSQAFEKLHSTEIPQSEKASLLDFHRTYVGFIRTQLRNTITEEYERVFHAYEKLVKDSNVGKSIQFYGYLIQSALFNGLVLRIDDSEAKLKEAQELIESLFKNDPNYSIYKEEIFGVRNILSKTKPSTKQ